MTPSFELIARVQAALAPPHLIGETSEGTRDVIPIVGGTVDGPLLKGTVLPGGADWCLTRRDGKAEVWARYVIRLTDGAHVSVLNTGIAAPEADGSWRGRTTPRFDVGDGPHQWLRDFTFVGTLHAAADGLSVKLAFYKVT